MGTWEGVVGSEALEVMGTWLRFWRMMGDEGFPMAVQRFQAQEELRTHSLELKNRCADLDCRTADLDQREVPWDAGCGMVS